MHSAVRGAAPLGGGNASRAVCARRRKRSASYHHRRSAAYVDTANGASDSDTVSVTRRRCVSTPSQRRLARTQKPDDAAPSDLRRDKARFRGESLLHRSAILSL